MFSGRNHLLWKLTPGKATAILADPEVAAAISSRNKDAEAAGDKRLLLLVEGIAKAAELPEARAAGADAVLLG